MWTIDLLKQNARNSMKNYYWMGFLVCLTAAILSDSLHGSSSYFMFAPPVTGMPQHSGLYLEGLSDSGAEVFVGIIAAIGVMLVYMIMYLLVFAFAMLISMVIYGFLSNPIEVGKCAFFCKARSGDVDFSYLFSAFKEGRYMVTVKLMFWRMLYVWLWSMLFVIPGVIKSLEYTLIPYLITENPNLSKERVFEISKRTMEGEKANLFFLNLSFIGWYLLGILSCGIGIYFILPYHQATKAEFYACMRAKMIAQGITTEAELTGASVY